MKSGSTTIRQIERRTHAINGLDYDAFLGASLVASFDAYVYHPAKFIPIKISNGHSISHIVGRTQ